MIKNCVVCGKPFDARKCAITCSPECSAARKAETTRACGHRIWREKKLLRDKLKGFLTIPDAPDYEIDEKFICRNKTTGHIMTPAKRTKTSSYYRLQTSAVPSGSIYRTAVALRRQAVAAIQEDTFEPIPSVNGKYEIDQLGNVRNARTKKRLKPNCKDTYSMHVGGNKFVHASRNNLLWEVHGRHKKGSAPVAVRAVYRNQVFSFKSCAECARFLLGKLYYALHTLQCYLWKRKPEFAGWKFTYIEPMTDDVTWNSRRLNSIAHHDQKVWEASQQI